MQVLELTAQFIEFLTSQFRVDTDFFFAVAAFTVAIFVFIFVFIFDDSIIFIREIRFRKLRTDVSRGWRFGFHVVRVNET
ncbi:Uncharacterised protein [Vibrio cholerae]|uniref:Uncharacterized protein n=1 Tax=Vibrio cholerae TaxID=666 RepID=A0A655QQ53_VIBCL|nr:Uncharacterised protein [Vibrio cholerae]CSC64056.1 Uncharacterised protein [Vibrio cholerae]CSD13843.1 Uncharacterised protein [Vibrio cholerae]